MTDLKVTGISKTEIDLFWNASTDIVGAIVYLASVETLSQQPSRIETFRTWVCTPGYSTAYHRASSARSRGLDSFT